MIQKMVVFQFYPHCVGDDVGAFGRWKGAVCNRHVGDFPVRQAFDENGLPRERVKFAVAYVYVAHARNEISGRAFRVFQRHVNARPRRVHGAVADEHIFDEPAARGVGFEAHGHVEIRAVEAAVLGEDIAQSAGRLAAERHAAVTVLKFAVLNDDVLARDIHAATVMITT